jgi:hemolysin activation/secretion protein
MRRPMLAGPPTLALISALLAIMTAASAPRAHADVAVPDTGITRETGRAPSPFAAPPSVPDAPLAGDAAPASGANTPGARVAPPAAAGGEVQFVVTELRVEGDNPLPPEDVQALLLPYLGEHEGFLGLQGAAEALEELLRARGFAFHRVSIPRQRTSSGSIRFLVQASRIGTIAVEGAEHYTADDVRRSLPVLVEGGTPNSRALARQLELANSHPTRRLGMTMKKSERAGYLDATLKVQDRSPHQFFSTINNRGSEETGEARWAVGYQHSDVFGLDHVATLTFTTSPGHWSDVAQYGFNYSVPLYGLGGTLSAFYSYSDVDSGTIADFFEVSGQGKFGGVRYLQNLLPFGKYRHRAELSVEDRLFDNNVDFRGRPIGVDVRTRPVGIRYSGEWVYPNANVGFNLGASVNLPGGSDNDDDAYNRSRTGADNDWRVLRYGLNADYSFASKWLLRSRLNGQYSRDPLISGEQIGFGGSDVLRGYDERAVAADRGVQASVEAWAPPVLPSLSLLAFADGAYGKREQVQPGESRALTLSSVGLGARWRPNEHISLTVDVGVVTNGAGSSEAGDARVHATLLVR